ncbi:TetR/AcrR family transcriptional regulator [Aerococcus urinae]|uniref:TetR/AcrR family transcriptional regulator n=1 Tax=Aerococcus mictus TaxID=2976810 RepID=A0A1E9PGA7_9LACT|nr:MULTISPECIES: TetR/AcrR family transcriptional regulator [Aerococcus]KAA9292197.1 TetR/AcrR family transcriptional regulator [Aerococcus mictus]MBU5609486.1 TetR/AcrR family transcriptional regulator [Aerococcus urinae]MCY3033505.1 TetR/AcrR family transcriptional regulator [Aerococcus mictus]MCY3064344.1 TetR/AcrR family transcriptional regulator [Aerococcus mictus]MCY3065308.1 TetR/AcrR family transcriptional regulator [Aerococcus mictus]
MTKDNREKLIKATDRLLRDRSISSITTKEITKEAGVSVGVFYNYFTSKEDVFTELVKSFFNYSLAELERLKAEITGNNLRSELKFKEFLVKGMDKNWENRFLNSDILMLSRKGQAFRELMLAFNEQMVAIIVAILTIIQDGGQDKDQVTKAKLIMNLIQNSYPVFSSFEDDQEQEAYMEKVVKIIFDLSFNE